MAAGGRLNRDTCISFSWYISLKCAFFLSLCTQIYIFNSIKKTDMEKKKNSSLCRNVRVPIRYNMSGYDSNNGWVVNTANRHSTTLPTYDRTYIILALVFAFQI